MPSKTKGVGKGNPEGSPIAFTHGDSERVYCIPCQHRPVDLPPPNGGTRSEGNRRPVMPGWDPTDGSLNWGVTEDGSSATGRFSQRASFSP